MKQLSIYLSEDQYEQLREDAFEARKSMTALLRDSYFGAAPKRSFTGINKSDPEKVFVATVDGLKQVYGLATADEVVTRCTCPPKRFPVQHRAKIQATVCAAHEATCPMFDEFAGE